MARQGIQAAIMPSKKTLSTLIGVPFPTPYLQFVGRAINKSWMKKVPQAPTVAVRSPSDFPVWGQAISQTSHLTLWIGSVLFSSSFSSRDATSHP
jgi:hypothetical protein